MFACNKRGAAFFLLVLCAFAPIFSLYCLLNLYVDYFFWDEWNLLVRFSTFIFDGKQYAWHVLWEPHFSHRLVLLKLLSGINFYLSGGNQLRLLLFAWLVQVSLFVVLISGRYLRFVPSITYTFAAFCLSLILFTPSMTLAWVWPVCLQQILTSFFFCWTMVLTGRLVHDPRLFFTISFAILCTFSSGNGIVVWPASLMLGAIIRVPLRRLTGIAAAGAITLFFYFYELPVEKVGDTTATLYDKLLYAFAFVGSPFSNGDLTLAIIFGSAGFFIYSFLFLISLWHKNSSSIIALSFAWLTIASAYAGASYRIGDGGVEQALVDRYIPLILPFWAGMVISIVCTNMLSWIRTTALGMLMTLSLFPFMQVIGPDPIDPKAFHGSSHALVRLAHEGLREQVLVTSGVNPYVNLYLDLPYLINLLSDMKRHAIGPFRLRAQYDSPGGISLGDRVIPCEDCVYGGFLGTVEPVHLGIDTCEAGYETGAVVRGTVSITQEKVREILLVNERDEVVGKGFPVGQFRSGPDPASIRYSGERRWVGFVSGKYFPKESNNRMVKGLVHLHDDSRYLVPLEGYAIAGSDLNACKSSK
jgi:hypothetical protein